MSQTVGPLQAQNLLSEIEVQGSTAQGVARGNLGIGIDPGPFLPLTGGALSGALTVNAALTASPLNQSVTFAPTGSGVVTINPATLGSLNNISIGGVTAAPVRSTTLTATSTVSLSPANTTVTISPSGTGTVVISPAVAGSMDNMVIGGTTPLAVHATTFGATGAVTLSPANANVVISPTGTGLVTINPATAGTVNNVSVGQTTPLAGKFTALQSTSTFTPATIAGIVGTTTNDSAQAGSWQEYTAVSVGPVSLSNGANANLITQSIGAGDWEIMATVQYVAGSGATMGTRAHGISTTSLAFGSLGTATQIGSVVTGPAADVAPSPLVKVKLASTTNVYCVAQANFSGGTVQVAAQMRWNRAR